MTAQEMETRVRRLEDRLEIAGIQARYTIFIDDHDLARVAPLFARNGRFRSADGVMDAIGREAICAQYKERFKALRFGFHTTQDHVIDLDDADPDRAVGIVSSHAEVVRNGRAMVVGMRYYDEYVREGGAWRIADRNLHFFYYVPVDEYAAALSTRERQRAYGDRRPAELPETRQTYAAAD
ncbi:MAG: DUF4440 domain-containing protein [Alphaproteobacteria bacterium]|nr:DUF4440 domain-containing protein [Alphaproteobacteria bacterium]